MLPFDREAEWLMSRLTNQPNGCAHHPLNVSCIALLHTQCCQLSILPPFCQWLRRHPNFSTVPPVNIHAWVWASCMGDLSISMVGWEASLWYRALDMNQLLMKCIWKLYWDLFFFMSVIPQKAQVPLKLEWNLRTFRSYCLSTYNFNDNF